MLALAWCVGAEAEPPAALGTLTGEVIWVDFWASWCAPCRRSFPWLNEMQAKHGTNGLQVIGVNLDKERELAADFLAETPASFAISYDPGGQLAETFEVLAMPSSFLIDREGRILARHYGFKLADTEEYERTIKDALDRITTSN
jgi:cytochrome c biogenesis protein CcmG/thiol:disulfide interchange protein DsbE